MCSSFIGLGVKKLRITGGEPLVRRDIMTFFNSMSRHLESGALKELTLTTNGSQLERFADQLYAAGVRRVNVSLDTLDEAKFAEITRWGRLPQVMRGIDAAQEAGLRVKINTVALKGFNEKELFTLTDWCASRDIDLTFIEVMPMGVITPLSHNFCESCNRVRITCTGEIYTCLGQEGHSDLRGPLRSSESDAVLENAIRAAIALKPKGHDFDYSRQQVDGQVSRHMSHTGG